MGVNNLSETVTRQRRGCDLNPGPSVPESSTLTTRLLSHCNYRTKDPNACCNRVSSSSASTELDTRKLVAATPLDFCNYRTRHPNAGCSRVLSITSTITSDQNAGSSQLSLTTATTTKDSNAGSSHASWTTATIIKR